ncbi:DUF6893 family small protein [Streptosporangium soli]
MRKLRVAALVGTCALTALVVLQWPEIHRYLKMKRM